MRVLVIEDDAIVGTDISNKAADMGFSDVSLACDEAEAAALARASHPDLVIADRKLGVSGSGARAVTEILQRAPTRVLFVTGFLGANETFEDEAGIVTLGKPFSDRGLEDAIRRAVAQPVCGAPVPSHHGQRR